jgi:pimeloyl-ACP methyl ester carboxylesterase
MKLAISSAVAACLVVALALGFVLLLALTLPGRYAGGAHPESRMLQLSGGLVRYVEEGEASGDPPLLLLHGYQGTLSQWDETWAMLQSCPARRLRVDIPGFGLSVWDSRDFSLETQADRLAEFLDQLGIARVTLAGTSMGGSLAATIAARHPARVAQLALFAPSGYPDALTYDGLFGMLVKPGPLNRIATWITDTAIFRRAFPTTIAAETLTTTASYGQPWAESLQKIRAPTFIAWSTGDRTSRPWAASKVHEAIARSVLLTLDDATQHSVPNTRPELTATLLCRLALGATPEQLLDGAAKSLLRPGETLSASPQLQDESPSEH